MLRKTTEERIFAQADKILAMEENLKSLSWHRVKEIGQALQSGGLEDEARRQLGRELLGIANANISLAAKLDCDLEGTGNASAISPDIARAENNQGFAFGIEEAKRSIGVGEPDHDKLPDPSKTFFFSQGPSSFEALESDGGIETAAFVDRSETVEARQEPAAAERQTSPSMASSLVDDPFDDTEEDDDAWRDKTAAIDYQLLETFEPMIDPYQVMNGAKDSPATDEAAVEQSAGAAQAESAPAASEPASAPAFEVASESKTQPVHGYEFKPKVKHVPEQKHASAEKQPAVKADDVAPSATDAQHIAEGEPSLAFDAPQLSAAQRAIENDKKKHADKKHKHKGKHEGKHKDKKRPGKKA